MESHGIIEKRNRTYFVPLQLIKSSCKDFGYYRRYCRRIFYERSNGNHDEGGLPLKLPGMSPETVYYPLYGRNRHAGGKGSEGPADGNVDGNLPDVSG